MTKKLINGATIRKYDLEDGSQSLNIVEGSKITVRKASDNTIANIFDPNDEGLQLANPFNTSDVGQFAFYVDAGVYRVKAESVSDAALIDGEVLIDCTESAGILIESYGGGANKTGAENAQALINAAKEIDGQELIIGSTGKTYLFDAVNTRNGDTSLIDRINIKVIDGTIIESTMNSAAPLWLFYAKQVVIKGAFEIDCKDFNGVGIRVRNDSSTGGHNKFEDFTVKNVLQQSAITSDQANGITVWGAFESSTFDRVSALKVHSDGPKNRTGGTTARGLVCRYDSVTLQVSKRNYFNDCKIVDLAPAPEADGIFCQQNPFFYGSDAMMQVKGCYFEDCLKRSVKSQVEHTVCIGNVTVRRKPSDLSDEPGAFGIDYDMQYSNATCRDNQCFYYGGDAVPQSAFVLSSHQTLEKDGSVSVENKPTMSGTFDSNVVKLVGSGNPKLDFINRGFRFLTLQNRTNTAGGFIDFNLINVNNNECDVPSEMFVWGFLINRQTATQVKLMTIKSNFVRSVSNAFYVTSSAGETGSSRTAAEISGITTSDKAVKKVHKQDTGTDKNEVTYNPKVNDYMLGATKVTFTGQATNATGIAVNIIVPKNTQYKLTCSYGRRSNSKNQVRSYVELICHDSSLGGVRGLSRKNETFDRQAGQWFVGGNVGNNWSEDVNYTVSNATKTAGVTSDAYGSQLGDYFITLECPKPCLIGDFSLSVGSDSSTYNMDYLVEGSVFTAIVGATHSLNSAAVPSCSTPTNPQDGDEFTVVDFPGFFENYNFTVNASAGSTIDGDPSIVLDVDGLRQTFKYVASSSKWIPNKAIATSVATGTTVIAARIPSTDLGAGSTIEGSLMNPVQTGNWINVSGNVLTANTLGLFTRE